MLKIDDQLILGTDEISLKIRYIENLNKEIIHTAYEYTIAIKTKDIIDTTKEYYIIETSKIILNEKKKNCAFSKFNCLLLEYYTAGIYNIYKFSSEKFIE